MGKGSQILRIFVCLVIGFLPSFLFVTILVPGGSPFNNYINFLKDYNSSLWAWICAGGLMLFTYLLWNSFRYLNNPESKSGKRFAVAILVLLMTAILFLILTQVYLYGKFLMGNDLLIELSSDKDNLFFSQEQPQEVTFKISSTMNPFCAAECHAEYYDLSSGWLIDSEDFNITPLFPKSKTYTIESTKTNEAQRLNLFSVKCRTQKERFCYTKSNEVERSVLITLNYGFDEQQRRIMNDSALCCLNNLCEKCCDNDCSDKNYPVIFLHGHSVNRALPPDYSLNALAKIKDKLTNEGYIDAGDMVTGYVREQPGLWGMVNAPVAVTASYFFDVYKTQYGEELIVPSKTESIDTYAIRLRDIIGNVKYRTNKDKVIIVAHSMGGLVTRRYVQIFGDSEIEKAIFITIPNQGIDGKVRDYCALLGEGSTCDDMDKDSIFINRLDNSLPPSFPIENVIGIGCDMGPETGDGIVKNSSQFLSFAKNHYIEGMCNELELAFLHKSILDVDKYPEVYDIINKTIRD